MTDEIINKVANSGLITFDLEEYYPKGERYFFDMKEHLFEGLLLKKKNLEFSLNRIIGWNIKISL